ncbi:MAG TPA: thiamine phosphate synthase [Verrucomicrobiae bacterium]|nr:thiamine phosphate synthase [Verrucomicrobiae bacterium]
MSARLQLPRVYPIIDAAQFRGEPSAILQFAGNLITAGATFIQYRDKSQDIPRILSCARELQRVTRDRATLIINDRTDLCLAADAGGVHLGQDDLSPAATRRIFTASEQNAPAGRKLWIGFSTHNMDQVREADQMPVDYIAVGPVFATAAKANPDPVIGLDGLRQARAATTKPLVAIGGITRKNCREVMEAGADSVAVITDLLGSPAKAFAEFLRVLG